MDEPTCCDAPMVHNSGTGQYECADAYFALLDDGVIFDHDPPGLQSPETVSSEHRAMYDHWLKSMRPDGWDLLAPATAPSSPSLSEGGAAR